MDWVRLVRQWRKPRSRFKRAGVRWTASRERALQLLFEAVRPVEAYELMSEFKPLCRDSRRTCRPERLFDGNWLDDR